MPERYPRFEHGPKGPEGGPDRVERKPDRFVLVISRRPISGQDMGRPIHVYMGMIATFTNTSKLVRMDTLPRLRGDSSNTDPVLSISLEELKLTYQRLKPEVFAYVLPSGVAVVTDLANITFNLGAERGNIVTEISGHAIGLHRYTAGWGGNLGEALERWKQAKKAIY